MDDHKAKDQFCDEHRDQSDADFHELVKRTGWLKDPLVRELFRRLGEAPGLFYAMAAEDINAAAQARLEAELVRAHVETRKLIEPVLEMEEAVSPMVAHRKGPKSKYIDHIVKVIRLHGPQPKGSLVKACLKKWPDNRVAISNRINLELKYKDGLLKEQPHNKFIALRPR
jgi:hypothetical protein